MIQLPVFQMKEVVPVAELAAWKQTLPKINEKMIPSEVLAFIDAMANKLPDFGRIRIDKTSFTGYELKLAGMTHIKGEAILDMCLYPTDVPVLAAIDNRTTMVRIFLKRGKQGLIDFCKNKASGTDLSRLLEVLKVHVFYEESETFNQVLADIKQAPPL